MVFPDGGGKESMGGKRKVWTGVKESIPLRCCFAGEIWVRIDLVFEQKCGGKTKEFNLFFNRF